MNDPHAFDAKRAAAGDPIQFCKTGGFWVDVHFIGLTQNGTPAVQFKDGSTVHSYALRMKPMPTKKWVLEFSSRDVALAAERVLRNYGVPSVPDLKEIEVAHVDA